MIFSPGLTKAPTLSSNTLDGVSLQSVDYIKYLGILLDILLNFQHKINDIVQKLKFTLGFLQDIVLSTLLLASLSPEVCY